MGRVRKFLHLSSRDQLFLVKTAGLVGLIRLGLWVLPFQTLGRLLTKLSPATPAPPSNPVAANRIGWAVDITSRYIPDATCLTQALAAQFLLKRRGVAAELRIGVAKSATGQFEAHAWVESDGQVVIGGVESPHRFAAFPSLELDVRPNLDIKSKNWYPHQYEDRNRSG